MCCAMLSFSVVSDSCNPMDCSPPGSSVHGILQARILEWVAMPTSGDLPNLGIKPRSPALQVDSLPSELPRKPVNTGVGGLSLLQGIFLTQKLNWGLLHYRWILYQLSHQGKSIIHSKNDQMNKSINSEKQKLWSRSSDYAVKKYGFS